MEQAFQILEKIKETLFAQTENKVELFYEKYPVHLQGKENSTTYEICLKTKELPHFKYRFMFIEYLDNDLPILLDIDEDIIEELKLKSPTLNKTMFCNTFVEFENHMKTILGSSKIDRVVKKLLKGEK